MEKWPNSTAGRNVLWLLHVAVFYRHISLCSQSVSWCSKVSTGTCITFPPLSTEGKSEHETQRNSEECLWYSLHRHTCTHTGSTNTNTSTHTHTHTDWTGSPPLPHNAVLLCYRELVGEALQCTDVCLKQTDSSNRYVLYRNIPIWMLQFTCYMLHANMLPIEATWKPVQSFWSWSNQSRCSFLGLMLSSVKIRWFKTFQL